MTGTYIPADTGVDAPDGRGHISQSDSNSEMFARILSLYAANGADIADVTYGNGTFWSKVDASAFTLKATDIVTDGIDATNLPYDEESLDMLVFDPPYRYVERRSTASHTDSQYRLSETLRDQPFAPARSGIDGVIDLYVAGISEAGRVLRHGGIAVIKCQDTVAHGKQRWIRVDVMEACANAGLTVVDLAIVTTACPPPTRWKFQRSLRKAHSYFVIARKGGFAPHGYKAVGKR